MSEIQNVAKSAAAGIRDSLAAGKEIEAVVKDVVRFTDAEAAARMAFRKKQQQARPDMSTFSAVEEWKRFKEIRDLEEKLRADILREYGKGAWDEIQKIKDRHIKDYKLNKSIYADDVRKLRALMLACFAASAVVTMLLYKAGLI